MSTMLIISSLGFLAALILLFYFIVKYKQAQETQEDDDLPLLDEVSAAAMDAKRLFGKNTTVPAGEILDIKDKLKELHYRIEEIKLTEEKRNNELTKLVEKVEQRITTFENEYVNKLQPTLYSLISELENIQKTDEN